LIVLESFKVFLRARRWTREETYEVHDDFTVGVSLEDDVLVFESLSKGEVVVDLSVDTERDVSVVADERLSSGV